MPRFCVRLIYVRKMFSLGKNKFLISNMKIYAPIHRYHRVITKYVVSDQILGGIHEKLIFKTSIKIVFFKYIECKHIRFKFSKIYKAISYISSKFHAISEFRKPNPNLTS